jgi:hypothetical protein
LSIPTIQQVVADFDIMLADHDPYVYGGISFYTGADCSGWIYESLVSQGVENPARTSQAQFAAWPPAPGPGYGIAVFFNVPSDGGSQPGHVALCLGNGTMAEEPHTGLDAEVVPIPNIPGVESIMGYRYLPVSYGTPATTTTTEPTTATPKPPVRFPTKEEIMATTPIPTSEFPNRVLITAIGADDGNGRNEHLMVFTINDATNPTAPGYNVIDVTDGIGTAAPYTVQSA